MVARLTIGKKAYAGVDAQAREILAEAEQLRGELRRLVDEDAAAYAGVSQAYKIPKADPAALKRSTTRCWPRPGRPLTSSSTADASSLLPKRSSTSETRTP